MKVEFYAADDEQHLAVASASWDGREITISADDDAIREQLAHAFRRSPMAVDDRSFRRLGTSGPVVIQPGSLEWFRAVARYRATVESGLAARFVAVQIVSGYDPAANYRPFGEQMERLDAAERG